MRVVLVQPVKVWSFQLLHCYLVHIWVTVSNSTLPAGYCLCYLCAVCTAQQEHGGTQLNSLDGEMTEKEMSLAPLSWTTRLKATLSQELNPQTELFLTLFFFSFQSCVNTLFCKAETKSFHWPYNWVFKVGGRARPDCHCLIYLFILFFPGFYQIKTLHFFFIFLIFLSYCSSTWVYCYC